MEQQQSLDPASPTTYNILFVCTGNTCRSPMAEAVARDRLRERHWSHVQVASAGVAAEPGCKASPQAVAVAERRGLDLTSHTSRPLTPELVEWADLILAMSPAHLRVVARLGGEHKMALLGEFAAGSDERDWSVPDPFGGNEEEYDRTLHQLDRMIQSSLDRLAPILHP